MEINDRRFNNKHPIRLIFSRYLDNNNICLRSTVLDPEFEEPWATYTVNMNVKLPDSCVAIKTWSEGTNADLVLLAAGVIKGDPVEFIDNGFIVAPVYKLSDKAKKEFNLK
jgi:hypothetical protein